MVKAAVMGCNVAYMDFVTYSRSRSVIPRRRASLSFHGIMEVVVSHSTSLVKQGLLAGESNFWGAHFVIARGRGPRADVVWELCQVL